MPTFTPFQRSSETDSGCVYVDDLNLAAYLASAGHHPAQVFKPYPNAQRSTFVFPSSTELAQLQQDFSSNDTLNVNLRAFMAARSSLINASKNATVWREDR